jgi:hypothetical protein
MKKDLRQKQRSIKEKKLLKKLPLQIKMRRKKLHQQKEHLQQILPMNLKFYKFQLMGL